HPVARRLGPPPRARPRARHLAAPRRPRPPRGRVDARPPPQGGMTRMELVTLLPLLWLLLLLPLAAVYAFSLVDRPGGRKVAAFLLRVLGVVFLVLALCGPYVEDR